MRVRLLLAGLGMLAATGGLARADDACQQFKWPVTREREAFAGAALPTLKSGDTYPGLLEGVHVALGPQGSVAYPVPPARKPKADPAFGAVLQSAPIAQAGTYQITLSGDAWVDVVQNGKLVRSSAFSGMVGCPGIRKSVRFPLAAGLVTIEISDSALDTLQFDMLPAQ